MKNLTIALALVFLSLVSVNAQTETAAENEFPDSYSVVYVYSLATHATFGKIQPSVFVDEKEVAQIRPNRFFILKLAPGDHEIHFKKSKKRGGIAMEFEAGKIYFLRVNWKTGGTIRAEGFDLTTIESARYDLKQLKPIDDKNIKDKDRVSTKVIDFQ